LTVMVLVSKNDIIEMNFLVFGFSLDNTGVVLLTGENGRQETARSALLNQKFLRLFTY